MNRQITPERWTSLDNILRGRQVDVGEDIVAAMHAAWDTASVRDDAALTHSGWVFRIGPWGRPVGHVAVYRVADRMYVGVGGGATDADAEAVVAAIPSMVSAALMGP
ncbi:MAG: hypothetical protein EBT79_07495 [Actinobacteria bacterium]|nr:hypothetical protein [Actinomycetota bacterium]